MTHWRFVESAVLVAILSTRKIVRKSYCDPAVSAVKQAEEENLVRDLFYTT